MYSFNHTVVFLDNTAENFIMQKKELKRHVKVEELFCTAAAEKLEKGIIFAFSFRFI